jgi:hypothetical protein
MTVTKIDGNHHCFLKKKKDEWNQSVEQLILSVPLPDKKHSPVVLWLG